MKKLRLAKRFSGRKIARLLLLTKLTIGIVLFASLHSMATGNNPTESMSLNLSGKKAVSAGLVEKGAGMRAGISVREGTSGNIMCHLLHNASLSWMLRGRVMNEKNEPVEGASVFNFTTSRGVATNASGQFAIEVLSAKDSIVVTAVGYKEKTLLVGNGQDVSIILEVDEARQELEQVVIVGYGQQKKESVTAAISTISAEELVQSPVANISNALAGRLSGLTSIQTSGKPGSDASTLYVRGIGTYTDQTSPLIMVDGVARNSYNDIDPNEIETISLLKDASATAVYGVRGANGVVLITTKRGREGAPRINLSAQTAMSEFTRKPSFVNSYEYATLQNEKSFELYWINHAKDADITTWNDFLIKREANWVKESSIYYKPEELLYYKNAHAPTLENGDRNPYYNPYFYPDVDWTKMIFKNYAPQSQANINMSGGTGALKYFVSLGYLTQGGLFKTDYMPFSKEMDFRKNRYNLRGNFDFDVNKDFRISVDIGTQFVNISGMDNDGFIWEKRILWSTPLSSPGIIDGKFVVPYSNPQTSLNPLYEIVSSNNYNLTNNSTLNSSIRLTHKLDFITQGLSVNARGAYDSYFSSRSGGTYSPVYYGISPNPNGDVLDPIFSLMKAETPPERWSDWYNGKWRKIYGEFSLNYARSFGDHTVSGLLLYNLEKLFDPGLAYHLPKAYIGSAARFTYAFKSRYLAEVNMGYNGSENFPENKRFGFLPAYSLGWVVSNESFFPRTDFLSYLKIRGSLGKVGNDRIGGARYLYLPDVWTYGGAGYSYNGYSFGTLNDRTTIQGAQEGTLGNPNVTWETATKANVGFELKLFKSRLSLTYDFFNEKRVDILSYRGTVPGIVQASLPPYNLGRVKNWGNEFELTYRDRATDKLDYWVKANVSTNHNKILFSDEAIASGLEYQATTGRPIGQGLYLQANGLYTSWADLYAIDGNGDPILSQPVLALNKNGQPYKNEAGNDVYQKDLGYGGVAVQPGEVRLTDVNEDGIVNEKDYIRTGNTTIPKVSYGVSFGINWNGFDISVLFQGVSGVAKYAMSQMHFNKQESLFDIDLNRFTLERYNNGERIDFPIAAYDHTSARNTYFLKNTSYTRLKNMEVGYTFKPVFLRQVGISAARIYVNGSNLFTWSPNKIWGDPENLAYIGYPLTRIYNLGINVNF
ncbi:MAG: TonB-dependent receptor [Niabella sp.]